MFRFISQRYISTTLGIIYTAYTVASILSVAPRAYAQSTTRSEKCSDTAIANPIQRFSSSGSDVFDVLIACGENSVAPLIQVLNNTSSDPLLVRGTAVDALSKIELNPEAVVRSLLLRLHWEQDARCRGAQYCVLASFPTPF
ncbi:MAG: hypothetical protein HC781_19230 [Leptolyngbyaceae cyanobacterium CSU_1_4]|nr:hypothetical protein [Leptolyngbyaceae cyanobacterium CSU_1_4]